MIQILRYYEVDENEIHPTGNRRCAAALVGARLPRIGDIYVLADKVEHLTTITTSTRERVEEIGVQFNHLKTEIKADIGDQLKNFKTEFKEEMQNGMKTCFDECIRNLKLIHKDQDEPGRALISGMKILSYIDCAASLTFGCCRVKRRH